MLFIINELQIKYLIIKASLLSRQMYGKMNACKRENNLNLNVLYFKEKRRGNKSREMH